MAYATATFTTAAPSQKSPKLGRCACSELFLLVLQPIMDCFSFNQESIYRATTVTGAQESWLWADQQLVKKNNNKKQKNNNILEAQNFFKK